MEDDTTISDSLQGKENNRAWKWVFSVAGIMSTLVIYGLLQEKIMRVPYGEKKEYFKYSLFLVFCNRITTAAVSAGALLASKKALDPVAPIYTYCAISISNILTTTCQYEALKYVSFPVQTLAKCAKMMPVMVWSIIIMSKRYSGADYLFAVFVTLGSSLFILYPAASDVNPYDAGRESTVWGIFLMIGYLGFDGFTSTFQDKLFKGYNMEIYNQIFYTTVCSCVLSFTDEWWRNFGIDDLELQTLAIRILSQTCSSSGCERNWSVFERIHTKRRNRLEHKRLNDLVYTHYNLRLKERQASRKSLTDPISLENIDLTDDWVVEAEDDDAPLLDVDEIDDWMDVADAILDEGEGGAAAGLILQGHLLLAVDFVYRHQDCFFDVALLSTVATASQFFISYTIRTFGALTFATIMITRQLLSILLSCIWFTHPLSWKQWIGAIIVFGSLYTKSYLRIRSQQPVVSNHTQFGNHEMLNGNNKHKEDEEIPLFKSPGPR